MSSGWAIRPLLWCLAALALVAASIVVTGSLPTGAFADLGSHRLQIVPTTHGAICHLPAPPSRSPGSSHSVQVQQSYSPSGMLLP